MPWFKIYAGMGGSFGGAKYNGTYEYADIDEATADIFETDTEDEEQALIDASSEPEEYDKLNTIEDVMQMNGKRMTTTMSSRYHIIISKPPPSSKFRKNCPECPSKKVL